MTLHPLHGHDGPREALSGALARGRLPRVLLFHGPRGVGKQRLALWTGQLLLCGDPEAAGPCGVCRGCRLAGDLQHPDLLWYFPLKRPPVRGSRERDDEALEEARIERLEEIRGHPLRPSHEPEAVGLHLGAIRNLRREAGRTPAMGPRRLFLIAHAEELVAQDSSPEAANALLKLLEEPPPETWFVLTSAEPGRLLPTIRSRTTALHVPALPRERVVAFLREERDVPEEEAEKAADLSGGSIGRALGFLPSGAERGPLEASRERAFFLLKAALSPRASERFARALSTPPSGARALHELLVSLETWLRDLAAAGMEGVRILNGDAEPWLRRIARERDLHPTAPARALALVEAARARAAGNVNPQLLLAGLLGGLHRELAGPGEAMSGRTEAE